MAVRTTCTELEGFFSNDGKVERELWVVRKFLLHLGVDCPEDSIKTDSEQSSEVDVHFDNARFQVKEIMDAGRRRHDEIRAAKGMPIEVIPYLPVNLTPRQAADHVQNKLQELDSGFKYSPAVRTTTDFLVYLNLLDHHSQGGEMPPQEEFVRYGWRSVSALVGESALVFWASAGAPDFLRQNLGLRKKVRQREELDSESNLNRFFSYVTGDNDENDG